MSKNVLVVDDQLGIRLLLSEVLRSEGFNVQDASSGEEALTITQGFQPDLILLDMKMPGMNGVDLLRHFRKRINMTIPIFMMTAYSELDMLDEAMRIGIDKQFAKPFDVFEISKAISDEVCKTPSFCG